MRVEELLAKKYADAFTAVGISPQTFVKCDRKTKEKIGQMGLNITPFEYSSFAFGNGVSAFVLSALGSGFLAIHFQFPLVYAAAMTVAASAFAVLASLQYLDFILASRARDVDMNILASSRHMLAAIKSGVPLYDAIAAVGRGGYGVVSELFSEAVVRIRDGEDIDAAFRSATERTPSVSFKRFVASLSHALGHGTKVELVLEDFVRQMEMRQKHEVSMFAAEATKLGLFAVMLTGIIPGMLVFLFSQMQIIMSVRLSIALLLPAYIVFLLVKYGIIVKLAKSAPGV